MGYVPMDELTVAVEDNPSPEDMEVFSTLREYNVEQVGDSEARSLTVFLRDASGRVMGGLRGTTGYGWLHLTLLIVVVESRRRGYGSMLLAKAEEEAHRRGCRGIY